MSFSELVFLSLLWASKSQLNKPPEGREEDSSLMMIMHLSVYKTSTVGDTVKHFILVLIFILSLTGRQSRQLLYLP